MLSQPKTYMKMLFHAEPLKEELKRATGVKIIRAEAGLSMSVSNLFVCINAPDLLSLYMGNPYCRM